MREQQQEYALTHIGLIFLLGVYLGSAPQNVPRAFLPRRLNIPKPSPERHASSSVSHWQPLSICQPGMHCTPVYACLYCEQAVCPSNLLRVNSVERSKCVQDGV